jgi:para-nitrobenzyl esterase
MPSAHGLFHRAGVMSGATLRLPTAEQAGASTDAFLAAAGVGKGDVGKLQAMSFEALLTAQAQLEAAARAKGEAPRSFQPSIDGDVIPGNPFDPAAPAISADVPMIISNVLDERAYRLANYDLDEAGLRAFIAKRVGEGRADAVLKMYRDADPTATPFVLQARFDTDESFRKPSIIETELKSVQAAAGGSPVWSYLYREPSPAYGGRYGVPHGSDVGPSLHDARGGLNETGPESLRLADEMASFWVAFAATGDPNNPRIPHWPAYRVPERATMVFGPQTRVEDDPRGAFREFWAKEPPAGR